MKAIVLDCRLKTGQRTQSSDRVRATFFIITDHLFDGSTILDHIVEQGHEIGNHGIADQATALLRPEIFAEQLNAAHRYISAMLHQSLRWYRPGRGLGNKAMFHCLRQMPGYVPRFALAALMPVDTFKPTEDSQFTAWYATRHIFSGVLLNRLTQSRSIFSANFAALVFSQFP